MSALEILLELDKGELIRSSKYFNYIGGKSTSAITAAGLSLVVSVTSLFDFYKSKEKAIFN